MAISIGNKEDCVGCWACSDRCPKQCISMVEDSQGFRYPKVNYDLCIECGLCEKVCPVIHQASPRKPIECFAAKSLDKKIQLASSSGGIFSIIAEEIIREGGVVFGARFNDNWEVIHDYTDTLDGLEPFRKSKYVQSIIGDNFNKCEIFLKEGRKVLFSGTPCQIAGLKRFLRKEYDNLLTIDFICHGVPSPLVWSDYLKSIESKLYDTNVNIDLGNGSRNEISQLKIEDISFRDKKNGWEKYGFSIRYSIVDAKSIKQDCQPSKTKEETFYEYFRKNLFINGFLNNIYLRPSCYKCPAKKGKSHSDITLGDFWGVKKKDPSLYDFDGVSLLIINTEKALNLLRHTNIQKKEVDFFSAISQNPSYFSSEKRPRNNVIFFKKLSTTQDIQSLIKRTSEIPITQQIKSKLIYILIKFGLFKTIRKLIKHEQDRNNNLTF